METETNIKSRQFAHTIKRSHNTSPKKPPGHHFNVMLQHLQCFRKVIKQNHRKKRKCQEILNLDFKGSALK